MTDARLWQRAKSHAEPYPFVIPEDSEEWELYMQIAGPMEDDCDCEGTCECDGF